MHTSDFRRQPLQDILNIITSVSSIAIQHFCQSSEGLKCFVLKTAMYRSFFSPAGQASRMAASQLSESQRANLLRQFLTIDHISHEIHFTDRIEVDDARKMRKLTFNHAAAMKNVTDNMEKYGLRLDIARCNSDNCEAAIRDACGV